MYQTLCSMKKLPILEFLKWKHTNFQAISFSSSVKNNETVNVNNDSRVTRPIQVFTYREDYIEHIISNFISLGKKESKEGIVPQLKEYDRKKSNVPRLKNIIVTLDKELTIPVINKSFNDVKILRMSPEEKTKPLDKKPISNKTFNDEKILRMSQEDEKETLDKKTIINKSLNDEKILRMSQEDENDVKNLLKESLTESYKMLEKKMKNNSIASYELLKTLIIVASKYGDVQVVKTLQSLAKLNYPERLNVNQRLDHYLVEALFIAGNHSESLGLLKKISYEYPLAKRVKETTCFIIKRCNVAEISSCNLNVMYDIACKYVRNVKNVKPALELWIKLLHSGQVKELEMADQLLDLAPNLLKNRDEKVQRDLISCALQDNNIPLLQKLIAVFIKLKHKNLLEETLGSLLMLFCLSDNTKAANEVMKFVYDEKLDLSPSYVRYFIDLLNRKKLPVPPWVLSFKS